MPASTLIRSDDLRNENRRRLLNTLRAEGPCSPARLRHLTGLSAASVSTLCTQMIEQGILISERYPTDPKKQLRGRPRSRISLNAAAGHILTITLTIDRISVSLVDFAGNVCGTREHCPDTRTLSSIELLATLCECVDKLCAEHDEVVQLHHIGVGFQGQTEHDTGALLWSPIIRERNVPLGATLHSRYAVSVSVHNDCRLIAQALKRNHTNLLGDTFATVMFSHGVGLGVYLNGLPVAGKRSSAMEFGHLRFVADGALCRCGKRGCIEAYAADYGIERLANGGKTDGTPSGIVAHASMNTLIAVAKTGDTAASHAFETAGRAVGEGLATLFTLLDPMPVALVGHSDDAFDLMRTGIHSILQAHLIDGPDPASLLHFFNKLDPLIYQGLIDNGLSQVDRLFADQNIDINQIR